MNIFAKLKEKLFNKKTKEVVKEISNIIYIFDKVLEFNYDMLAMDVIYNADKINRKVNVKKYINGILELTCKCVKNIYILPIYRKV